MTRRSIGLATLLAVVTAAPAIAFHNHLAKSVPAADEQLSASPKTIQLWFAEKVEPKFSSITLMRADSTKIETPKPTGTDDPKSIVTNVSPALPPGKYLVRWRTAGDDGHAVRGAFNFSVK